MNITSFLLSPFYRVLRIPVYRLALQNDFIARIFIRIYNFFSSWSGCGVGAIKLFNEKRAEDSLQRFIDLGAKIELIEPQDGKGKIQMMTLKAQDLEEKIKAFGASWNSVNMEDQEVLAITPPSNLTKEWELFKEKLLHLRFTEKNGMIITSSYADKIDHVSSPKCFFYTHTTSTSFISDWKRAGFYLGAKQDICFYDNGNIWKNSGRIVSESSFYLEADSVLQKLIPHYELDQIWVGGSCGGAPLAAYIKAKYHQEGINFFSEQAFVSLEEFKKPMSSTIDYYLKRSLEDPGQVKEDYPQECQFDLKKLWQDLQLMDRGKIVVIEVENDEHLSQDNYKQYIECAQKINHHVFHVKFTSQKTWRHSDDFFNDQKQQGAFWNAVFV